MALGDRRLTVRTLDIGGDKPVPYLPVATEANPFLGLRGVRLSLKQPDIFKQQLRALVRAGMEHPISVLFPMVSTIGELRTARAMLVDAAAEVGLRPGDLPAGFEVGAMAEVPAFALHARAAVGLVDIISIGTNDLTQYTLATDTGTPTSRRSRIPSIPRSYTSSPKSQAARRPGFESRSVVSLPRTRWRPPFSSASASTSSA